jgi:hypothetical protein
LFKIIVTQSIIENIWCKNLINLSVKMVDSCFKVFRKSKCFDKRSRCDSFDDSSFCTNRNEEETFFDHPPRHKIINEKNDAILRSDTVVDDANEIDDTSHVVERLETAPHRRYHYSITSTATSLGLPSSGDEFDEINDILYPLPHNERSFVINDDSKFTEVNGMTTLKQKNKYTETFYY